MASVNTATRKAPIFTHEGARASHINPVQQLRRLVMSCMLWESEFYVDGRTVAEQIREGVARVKPEVAAAIAIEAREQAKLRHVPLWIVREMARLETHKHLVAETLTRVIQRPDELAEFVALYWKDGKQPLSAQAKKGLAAAFEKFDEYQLAKYNRDAAVKLRDVLFLSHVKPGTPERESLYKKLVDGTLTTPDTWEVSLSAGSDKRATFERLIAENKLGALALLRNLRNMQDAGMPVESIRAGLDRMKADRVLPFRFIAAAKYAPNLEPDLERAMLRCLQSMPRLRGKTAILIDHSGSMRQQVSAKSEITRFDAASALAIMLREIADDTRVFTFSDACLEVPLRRGFALRDAIMATINPQWTLLGKAVRYVYDKFPQCERLIVITDEQSADKPQAPHGVGYIINVASAKNGLGYGDWVHIDGWSEAVIGFIQQFEGIGSNASGIEVEYADESAAA